MSIMNIVVNLGFTLGISIAIVSSVYMILSIAKRKLAIRALLFTIVGIICSVPFLLCEFYGEETVSTHDTEIYEENGSYITGNVDGVRYVITKNDDEYIKVMVEPNLIKRIEDGSNPKLQTVITYKKFSIFETTKQAHIIWIPEIN